MGMKPIRRSSRRRSRGKRHTLQTTFTIFWDVIRECWSMFRAFVAVVWASPPLVRLTIIPFLLVLLWFGTNWAFQTFQKPSEILFLLDRSFSKHPVDTWQEYESLFREHATAVITPEFLAALAQVEGGGNPIARTYWRWQLTWNPLAWYRPASSAVGMFQITNGTFEEAKHYCIHDHEVVEDGPWHDWHSCWFNSLYIRIVPSHAIEMTAALLDRKVTQTLRVHPKHPSSLDQKHNLAAVIHLCGFSIGQAYAMRNFQLIPNQQCGDHDVRRYLARINELKHRYIKSTGRGQIIRQAY